MPYKELMKWVKPKNRNPRWRKEYRGRELAVSPKALGCIGREDSREKANEWLVAEMKRIDEEKVLPAVRAMAKRKKILQWAINHNDEKLAERQRYFIGEFERMIAEKDDEDVEGFEWWSEAEVTILTSLESTVVVPADRQLETLTKSFLKLQEAKVASKQKKPRSYGNLERFVRKVVDFVGKDADVATMADPATLNRFYIHVSELVGAGALNGESGNRAVSTYGRLVKWIADQDLIATLPRNLGSKELLFKKRTTKPKAADPKLVKQAIDLAPGQLKLHLLLMANCGYTQADFGELKQNQIDWKKGRIIRKRTKTEDQANCPVVNYKLWPETFALLKTYRAKDSELALLTDDGRPWVSQELVEGKEKRADNFQSKLTSLEKRKTDPFKLTFEPKQIRKTSASLLRAKKGYSQFPQFFLGHAPTTTEDESYNDTDFSQPLFDEAVTWLRKAYGIGAKGKGAK